MRTFIARKKATGLHYLVRIVDKSFSDAHISEEDFIARFNSIASANNIQELVEAVDSLPPLLPVASLGGEARFVDVEDMHSQFESGAWAPCDEEMLRYESYCDAGALETDEGDVRALKAVVRRRDAATGEFAADLSRTDSAKAFVLVEPLLDWTFARNVLGLAARLLFFRVEESAAPMDDVGFKLDYNKKRKCNLYAIPFAFNPFFVKGLTLLKSTDRLNPLLERTLSTYQEKGWTEVQRRFDENGEVYLLTAPVATGEYRGLFSSRFETEERRYYLCIEENGHTQAEVADKVVSSFAYAIVNLRGDEGEGLGWDWSVDDVSKAAGAPEFVRHSMFSDFFYRLVYRDLDETTIVRCGHCGNAILDSKRGAPRLFCSSACRMRHQRREQASEGRR